MGFVETPRRHGDLLQGLGRGAAGRVQPRLAAQRRRLGAQMLFLAANGYRGVAHDRRGHGRSSQPWDGNDMDTYADDLAALIDALDLRDAVAGRPLHGRRRGGPLHRPPRHRPRRQGRAGRRRHRR